MLLIPFLSHFFLIYLIFITIFFLTRGISLQFFSFHHSRASRVFDLRFFYFTPPFSALREPSVCLYT